MHKTNPTNTLARPINLSVAQTVELVMQHHNAEIKQSSRLPVLAIHSVMTILVQESKRYKNCTVLTPNHRAIAKNRKDMVAKVHIIDAKDMLSEAYEIKRNVRINSRLIQDSFEKFRTTPVQRFYLLTTHNQDDYAQFKPDIQRVAQEHGAELIINGVYPTLRYYLRLIKTLSAFVDVYATALETDPSITPEIKQAWNQIAAPQSGAFRG